MTPDTEKAAGGREHDVENDQCWCRPRQLCGDCLSENCALHADVPLIVVHREEVQ
jgi:hypothetical protein